MKLLALLSLVLFGLQACGGGGAPADSRAPPSANKPAFDTPPAPGEQPR